MEKIRFGIVGIGMMGRMHATSLQRRCPQGTVSGSLQGQEAYLL